MYKRVIFIAIVCILPVLVWSQSLESQQVDNKTYQQYLADDWTDLIKTGNTALSENIDFYYLRYRLGIAYYNKKCYRSAVKHFFTVLNENPNDSVAKEYLYYSYLWGGRSNDAARLSGEMSLGLKAKLGIKSKRIINSVDVAVSTASNLNADIVDNFKYKPTANNTGYQTVLKDYFSYNIGMFHQVLPALSVYHSFGHLSKTDFLMYYYGNTQTEKNSNVKMNQYYMSLNYTFNYGIKLSSGFHFVNVRIPYETTTGQGAQQKTVTNYTDDNDVVVFAALHKPLGRFNIALFGSFANLNNENQIQKNATITYYPFGNLNLYTSYTLTHHTSTIDGSSENNIIHQALAGFKIFKFLWFEGVYAKGVMRNFTSSNAMIVNNSLNPTNQIRAGRFIIPLINKPLKFWLSYTNWDSESTYKSDITDMKLNILKTNYYSLTGGLLWNF